MIIDKSANLVSINDKYFATAFMRWQFVKAAWALSTPGVADGSFSEKTELVPNTNCD